MLWLTREPEILRAARSTRLLNVVASTCNLFTSTAISRVPSSGGIKEFILGEWGKAFEIWTRLLLK